MKVKAIKECFYGNQRRRPGTIFEIDSEKAFSARGMVKIEEEPEPKAKPKGKAKAQPEPKVEKSTGDVEVI